MEGFGTSKQASFFNTLDSDPISYNDITESHKNKSAGRFYFVTRCGFMFQYFVFAVKEQIVFFQTEDTGERLFLKHHPKTSHKNGARCYANRYLIVF